MGRPALKYLMDSVIVIDHLNGISPATAFLAENAPKCVVSVITRAEVLAGCDEETGASAVSLLNHFSTLPVTVDIADLAARMRRTERWKLPDAIQAAIAIEHKLTLVTRNSRDFQPGREPTVLIPYQF